MKLFLDDCPVRTEFFHKHNPGGISTMHSSSMIELLRISGKIDYLFLDHDLDGVQHSDLVARPNTGMDVVVWLEENRRSVGQIVVHSMNAHAAPVMYDRLTKARYRTVLAPFWTCLAYQFAGTYTG